MFKHILVAIDQSTSSQRAFEAALGLAEDIGAQLTLVHALDVFDSASPERPHLSADSYSMKLDKLLQENYERQWAEFVEHHDSWLKEQQAKAEAVGVAANCLQPYGRPGPSICKTARSSHADLIVVGSHGRKGFREMLLGSVSNYIMHHASCSVLVTHPDIHHNQDLIQEAAELNPMEMLT